ncbi:MAG: hypothetical protein M3Y28_10640 [Armatimonadota bacterium]|nr:hypothetical protein [Armatimonadota bacterium]
MTLTIELPEDLAARLTVAGVPTDDASRYALAALADMADRAEIRAWWDGLSDPEQELEKTKTRESLAAADAGRFRPAAEVYDNIRTKSVFHRAASANHGQ